MLLDEESCGVSAGACVGADNAADRDHALSGNSVAPQLSAVDEKFLQHLTGQTGVAVQYGHGEVCAALLDLGHQHLIGLAVAAGLAQNGDLAAGNGDDGLDGQQRTGQSGGGGEAATLFQILQRIESGQRFVTDIELTYLVKVLNVPYKVLLDNSHN